MFSYKNYKTVKELYDSFDNDSLHKLFKNNNVFINDLERKKITKNYAKHSKVKK